mgnify:FL=1
MGNTVIGNSIVIDGEIRGGETLIVHGTVRGRIHVDENLVIDKSGTVEADIETQTLEVSGSVTGNIVATDKVDLKEQCRVVGDIKARRVLISDGASFKGRVDMDI